jgi:hypothetical protein
LVLDGEAKQNLDKMLDTADNLLAGPLGEFLKHRISYFDKLIILNGGTLTLSFSAAATFYAHAAGKNHIPFSSLLTAWKLLMFSIVAALASNWLTMSASQKSYSLAANRLSRLRMLGFLVYFRDAYPNFRNVDLTPAIETKEIAAKELTENRVAKWADRVALFLGFLAQLTTFASYVYLYKFAGANVLAL